MTRAKIHPQTSVGQVALTVTDVERSMDYYVRSIGLSLLDRNGQEARLGVAETPLLQLRGDATLPVQRRRTGLYHFAILLPSRAELARAIQRLIDTGASIGGASDHRVSEALYLSDPDGHGIEMYRDRPQDSWPYQDGVIDMATEPMDVPGVMAELPQETLPEAPLPSTTRMGHIHLHVDRLQNAATFYQNILGFELAASYTNHQVEFVAAGGYHHHIAYNTWAGVGVPPPEAESARLDWFEILVPDASTVAEVSERLQRYDWPYESTAEGIFVNDSAQNRILLRAVEQ